MKASSDQHEPNSTTIKIHDRSNCSAFRVAPHITRSDGACRTSEHAHTSAHRSVRFTLAPSRNRSAKRTPASSVRMHHRRASRWFLSLPPNARDVKCTRAATRAATHVACRVTTNLAAYVLAESKGEPFICKILAHRKSRRLRARLRRPGRENPPRRFE